MCFQTHHSPDESQKAMHASTEWLRPLFNEGGVCAPAEWSAYKFSHEEVHGIEPNRLAQEAFAPARPTWPQSRAGTQKPCLYYDDNNNDGGDDE